MGTVHAKSINQEEQESTGDDREDRVDLQSLKAQVQRVHITGLGRTKEDVVIESVKDVFKAQDFQTVILKIHEARTRLEGLGCFRDVGVIIDTYEGHDSVQDGIQVTFEVVELKVAGLRVNTSIGHNEGSLGVGGALKNIFGRGEELSTNYTHGSNQTTTFGSTFLKPFHNEMHTKLKGNIYQSYMEAGWAGYKTVERGLLLGLILNPAPAVTQQLLLDTAWRQLSCMTKSSAFAVREHCGHTLKTALQHELSVDTRDNHIFPTDGQLLKLKNEVAGFGGNIGFLKNEASLQATVPLPFGMTAQASIAGGHLLPISGKGTSIVDRFVMGGPMTLRGFQMGGVGPHSDGCALGSEMFWTGNIHLLTPLPLLPQGSFTERFRLHLWVNTGNIGDFQMDGDVRQKLSSLVKDMRLSYGAGVALNVAGIARVELNYCFPLLYKRGDRVTPGMQFGIAAEIL